jgi:hypothetical protein
MTTTIEPAERDVVNHLLNGREYLYIGRITVNGDDLTVVPCRGITDRELCSLIRARKVLYGRDVWVEGPDGRTTYVSVPVDVDKAIEDILAGAEVRWTVSSTRRPDVNDPWMSR